jgi:hypothetical protein
VQGASTVGIGLVVCLLATAGAAGAGSCPQGNLLQLDGVRASVGSEDASRLLRERFDPEGTDPFGRALPLAEPLTIDLGATRTVRALMIQGEHDDVYLVEGSLDGVAWVRLTVARAVQEEGLRSRAIQLRGAAPVRQLRITPAPVGSSAVSAIAAWCRIPVEPPASTPPLPASTRSLVRGAQFAIALLGLLLFVSGFVLKRLGRDTTARRTRDTALGALGLLAGLAWCNFGLFHAAGFVHTWEHFHYFLGSKYFDELGYTRLYACVTVADLEDGLESRVAARQIRDMTTNRRVSTDALVADPDRCKGGFTAERWNAFKRDVAWFRGRLHPAMWERVFLDHGYNPPPTWTLLGRLLTAGIPASDGGLLLLASLDPLLLVMMVGAIVWAFGWRTAAVALLWWGTNRVADFSWTGGAFLRQEWLVLSIAGICLVRRRFPLLGGLAIGWAAMLRVFPGLIAVALALRVATISLRARRPVVTREQIRFAAGCLAAVAILLPLSAAATGGLEPWREFVGNVRANTRAAGANMIGLMKTLTYEHGARDEVFAAAGTGEADEQRREAARTRFRERRPVYWVLLAAYLLLLGRAVCNHEDWAALALGIGLIPVGVFVAGYYHAVLLGYGLLWKRLGDVVGLCLCALSVATHVGSWLWPAPVQMDTRFAWASGATLAVVVALTLVAARRPATVSPSEAR